MLNHIHISNLISLQEVKLDLLKGTTVITGETGAGKSILIDAVDIALGGRANADMVRQGQEKADISLSFDVRKLPDARAWLKNLDLDQDGECLIRRTIHKDGRSRSYINGMPTTLQPLRELSDLLINIHGQHENQSLMRSDKQRDMLDRYAGHMNWVDQVRHLAEEWTAVSQELKTLRAVSSERTSRSEFLRFQFNELDALHLQPDEFHTLDLEHKQLAHSGELLDNIQIAIACLSDDEENNALTQLNRSLHALETIMKVDPKIQTWVESIKNAILQVSDTEDDLRRYLESVDLDPERLQWLDQRISTLFDIARKHKVAPNELYDLQQRIATELNELDTSDERITELENKLNLLQKEYLQVATKLSESRAKAANILEREITTSIQELSLPHGQFHIHLEKEENSSISAHGLEKVIFQIKTNAGQSMQLLSKVASGGELSRISLAIHMATAEQHTIPTLIFDEVDVGIGGGVAEIVGKLLRRLGHTHQVLCITHLPQVAAQGQQHLLVKKTHENNMTISHIRPLNAKEKTQEIARMLGGVEITKKTLEHAKEMIESALLHSTQGSTHAVDSNSPAIASR